MVGVADDTWGEVVAVAAVTGEGERLDLASLQPWARERLSKEKVPRRLLVLSELPRNAMGKVQKPAVRRLLAES